MAWVGNGASRACQNATISSAAHVIAGAPAKLTEARQAEIRPNGDFIAPIPYSRTRGESVRPGP